MHIAVIYVVYRDLKCYLAYTDYSHAYMYNQYHEGEEVVLWMNTVGPYHNRQETYSFYLLPYCKGPQHEIGHYHETMAEALQGVELEFSGLEIGYKGMWTNFEMVSSFRVWMLTVLWH